MTSSKHGYLYRVRVSSQFTAPAPKLSRFSSADQLASGRGCSLTPGRPARLNVRPTRLPPTGWEGADRPARLNVALWELCAIDPAGWDPCQIGMRISSPMTRRSRRTSPCWMGIWRLARLDARPVRALRGRPLPDGVRRPAQPDVRPDGGTHDLSIFDTTHFTTQSSGPPPRRMTIFVAWPHPSAEK